MTSQDFRRLALLLPETVKGSHHGHPDFRVRGKVFATVETLTRRIPRVLAMTATPLENHCGRLPLGLRPQVTAPEAVARPCDVGAARPLQADHGFDPPDLGVSPTRPRRDALIRHRLCLAGELHRLQQAATA